MKKALIVYGGWDGHEPRPCADLFAEVLADRGFDVRLADDLAIFADAAVLAAQDLIVPMWTMGNLTGEQEAGLAAAVRAGSGLAGFHGGMGDAFRANTNYQFMVGGQFVCHPDGQVPYRVQIVRREDPIVQGIDDFDVTSEQYYMHVDPTNEVLATTTFVAPQEAPWVAGCVMPVAWKRMWGAGRVFYSSLGHVAADFKVPAVMELTKRGMLWASR